MKCQVCGESEATVHYIEIVEGQKTSQWLCSACAERQGITPSEGASLSHGGLESIVGGMLSSIQPTRPQQTQEPSPTCETCGYELNRLQETGLLGCPSCYKAFRRQLLPMLRRYHGATQHLGRSPQHQGPRTALRREIAGLRMLLEQAVAQEGYEEAARLRDEVREKERQIDRLQGATGQDEEDGPAAADADVADEAGEAGDAYGTGGAGGEGLPEE
jgi:protein arginine kinase activator